MRTAPGRRPTREVSSASLLHIRRGVQRNRHRRTGAIAPELAVLAVEGGGQLALRAGDGAAVPVRDRRAAPFAMEVDIHRATAAVRRLWWRRTPRFKAECADDVYDTILECARGRDIGAPEARMIDHRHGRSDSLGRTRAMAVVGVSRRYLRKTAPA